MSRPSPSNYNNNYNNNYKTNYNGGGNTSSNGPRPYAPLSHREPGRGRGSAPPYRYGDGRGHGWHHGPDNAHDHYTREERNIDDIFKDTTACIDFSKYEEIKVTITPSDVPPATTFDEMRLHPYMIQNIMRCQYRQPTPVQKYGVPAVLAGGDLMACAQTGSGKTAAYLLPAVQALLALREHASGEDPAVTGLYGRAAAPGGLVLAPTRELGIQIYDESRKFTYRTGLRCVVVYGGAEQRSQLMQLERGAHLVVATPGRLKDFFDRGVIIFRHIRYLVLDEADRMLDMGFEPQIRQLVEGRGSDMPGVNQRQTLLYSATFPREIQQLARDFLKQQHYFLQVGRVGSTTEMITQELRLVDDFSKRQELGNLLKDYSNQLVLVFVEKKRTADHLERWLFQQGFSVCSIHGDRVQRQREASLASFKAGQCNVLVATDVASRGLDIPDVSLVVQYDLPGNIDSYVHRIGRTGRAGKRGTAIGFFSGEKNSNIASELIEIMEEAKQQVPEWLVRYKPARGAPSSPSGQKPGRGRGGGRGGGGGYGSRGFGGRGGYNNNNYNNGGYTSNNNNSYNGGYNNHYNSGYNNANNNNYGSNPFGARGGYNQGGWRYDNAPRGGYNSSAPGYINRYSNAQGSYN